MRGAWAVAAAGNAAGDAAGGAAGGGSTGLLTRFSPGAAAQPSRAHASRTLLSMPIFGRFGGGGLGSLAYAALGASSWGEGGTLALQETVRTRVLLCEGSAGDGPSCSSILASFARFCSERASSAGGALAPARALPRLSLALVGLAAVGRTSAPRRCAMLPIKGPTPENDDDEPAQPLRKAHGLEYIRRFLTTKNS